MFRFDIETNATFYSSKDMRERKTIQQRSMFLYTLGKKERNIRFFMIESKKRIAFDHKKTKRWHP
jgi:hypothetical protein